jgi:hypothetical protein
MKPPRRPVALSLAVVVIAASALWLGVGSAAAVPRYRLTVFGPTFPTLDHTCPGVENTVAPNWAMAINNSGAGPDLTAFPVSSTSPARGAARLRTFGLRLHPVSNTSAASRQDLASAPRVNPRRSQQR